jgi:hypothetical protein
MAVDFVIALHTSPTVPPDFPFSGNPKRLADWFLIFFAVVGVDVDGSDGV